MYKYCECKTAVISQLYYSQGTAKKSHVSESDEELQIIYSFILFGLFPKLPPGRIFIVKRKLQCLHSPFIDIQQEKMRTCGGTHISIKQFLLFCPAYVNFKPMLSLLLMAMKYAITETKEWFARFHCSQCHHYSIVCASSDIPIQAIKKLSKV